MKELGTGPHETDLANTAGREHYRLIRAGIRSFATVATNAPHDEVLGEGATATAQANEPERARVAAAARSTGTTKRVLGLRKDNNVCRMCGYVHGFWTGNLPVLDGLGHGTIGHICGIPVLFREGEGFTSDDPSLYVLPDDGQHVLVFGHDEMRLAIAVHVQPEGHDGTNADPTARDEGRNPG